MAEDAAAPDAFEVAIALEAKDTEGVAAQVVRAHLVHNQTIKALTNFHSLYEITLESGEAGDLEQANSAQDLLRAMLLFACSGLDAVVKQLIEDSLHDVLQHDLGAQREFQKFVERRLKRTPASEESIYFCFLRSPAGSFTIGMVSNGTLTSSLPTFCTRRM